jgi:hypothetical protein
MRQFSPKLKAPPQPGAAPRRAPTGYAVSASGDCFEQEADRAADQVMAGRSRPFLTGASPGASQAGSAHVDPALAGIGRPLEPALRADMERRFGHDFGRVRVHSGSSADQSTRDLNANAYAIGRDIVFGAGRFAPATWEGRRLVAHELAHVVQQSQSPMPLIQREAFRSDKEKTETLKGPDSGPFAGGTFTLDPYGHTVVVELPDGTGMQYDYKVVQTGEGRSERVMGENAVPLSKLRVQALKRLEQVGGGQAQEGPEGPKKRKEQDVAKFKEKREEFGKKHEAEAQAYEAELAKWNTEIQRISDEYKALPKETKPKGGPKLPKPPAPPTGYPAHGKTTLCPAWPVEVFQAAGGSKKQQFTFTPPVDLPGWKTLDKNPEGPKPGDIYWLWDIPNNRVAHMGVFKSKASIPDKPDLERWVVTDGGQGEYEKVNFIYERSRTFNKKTGIFSKGDVAEAGQEKGDRRLVGWVDIEVQAAAVKKD